MSNSRFAAYGAEAPATKWVGVEPSDTVDLPLGPCRALWINDVDIVAVEITDTEGNTEVFNIAGPYLLPCSAARVKDANTSATDIIALY